MMLIRKSLRWKIRLLNFKKRQVVATITIKENRERNWLQLCRQSQSNNIDELTKTIRKRPTHSSLRRAKLHTPCNTVLVVLFLQFQFLKDLNTCVVLVFLSNDVSCWHIPSADWCVYPQNGSMPQMTQREEMLHRWWLLRQSVWLLPDTFARGGEGTGPISFFPIACTAQHGTIQCSCCHQGPREVFAAMLSLKWCYLDACFVIRTFIINGRFEWGR